MSSPKFAATRPEFSPLSLLRAGWKQKLIACAVTLVLSTIAIAIIYRLPPTYKAEALILVDPQKVPEKFVSSTVSEDFQDRLATISQEILSSTRLKTIIDDFHLYRQERQTRAPEEIIEIMRKDLGVVVEKGWGGNRPGAFRITFQGDSPTVVAQVVNRITNLYIEENLRTREIVAEGTAEFIENQLQDAKKKLDDLEATVSRYKLQHNGELPQQENSLLGTLSRLQLELQASQDALNRAQQNKFVIENALSAAQSAEAIHTSPLMPAIAGFVASPDEPAQPDGGPPKRSEVLRAQLDALQARYSEDHPDIKRLKNEIAATRRLEEQADAQAPRREQPDRAKTGASRPPEGPSPVLVAERGQARERVNALKSQLDMATREIQARSVDQQRILRDMAGYQRRVEQLPVREQEMAALTRDYEISKINYRSLLDKKIAAEMSTDLERRQKAERFRIIDPARPPQNPFKPKRGLLTSLALLTSLVCGMTIAIAKELKSSVLLGEWELPPHVPVLGRVPRIVPASYLEKAGAASQRRSGKPKFRFAMLCSVFLSLLGLMIAGLYLASHRP